MADSAAGFAWSFVITALLLLIINFILGMKLRLTERGEKIGPDIAEHGERAYDFVSVDSDKEKEKVVVWHTQEISPIVPPIIQPIHVDRVKDATTLTSASCYNYHKPICPGRQFDYEAQHQLLQHQQSILLFKNSKETQTLLNKDKDTQTVQSHCCPEYQP